MSHTVLLLVGPVQTLLQNQVYAKPARNVHIYSDTALQVSNDSTFSSNGTINANTNVQAAAAFIRCTTGNAVVRLSVD
jgi:hypothetical protein